MMMHVESWGRSEEYNGRGAILDSFSCPVPDLPHTVYPVSHGSKDSNFLLVVQALSKEYVLLHTGPFTSWPTVFLSSGVASATGFAMLNTLGSFGGFIGPFLVGVLVGHGGYSTAMEVLALMMLVAAALILGTWIDPQQRLFNFLFLFVVKTSGVYVWSMLPKKLTVVLILILILSHRVVGWKNHHIPTCLKELTVS